MPLLNASPHDVMRRAIAKIDAVSILNVVDAIQLKGAKLSAVVAIPLRNLQKKRDVAAFAAGAPIDAISGLLELMSMEPLEKVIAALGEHAESPDYEQLTTAVATLRGEGLSDGELIAVLAFAIGSEFPAAPHCRRLLSEDDALALPEIEVTIGRGSLLSPKVADESVREQRRQRREEEKSRKRARAQAATPRVRPTNRNPRRVLPAESSRGVQFKVDVPPQVSRRAILLTPAELSLFDPNHPLAGAVVTIEVPFDSVDPDIAERQSKIRPAVVVAGSEAGLLVRGIYTHPSSTRSLFTPWRRLGLDHISYVDVARSAVDAGAEIIRLGVLIDEEWNALL